MKNKNAWWENDFIQDGWAASLHAPQHQKHRWHKPRMAWLQWVLPDIPDWTCELIIYMDEHHRHHWKTRASGAAPGHARGRWMSRNGRDWARVPGEANLMFHHSEYTIRGWLTLTPATEEGGTHLARVWHPLKGFKHGLAERGGNGSISRKTTNAPRRKWVGVCGQHLSILLPLCTATTHDWMMDLLQPSELWGYSGDDSKTSMHSSGSAARERAPAWLCT